MKRHKKTHNKVPFYNKVCSKSYHREDHFQKHGQKCQNIDFSFSINKCEDFIPGFIGESCFYLNKNETVSNGPLDNSESITSLSENKNNGALLIFDKVENGAPDNSLIESELAISSIVYIGVSTSPLKNTHTPLSCKAPLNLQTVQVSSFLGNPHLYIGFL